MSEKALAYIIEQLKSGRTDLHALKSEACKKFALKTVPRNSEILESMNVEDRHTFTQLLKKRPMRTMSGVTPIAVMIKPQGSCKWGCIYCPFTGKAAKSYTGEEPAALRARDNDFDSYRQATSRLRQFESCGHPTDKCEVIVMGGTFLAMDEEYKYGFVKGIYDALNGKKSKTLEEAKKINETAGHRVVGLTVETRPDICTQYIDEMLEYGTTKVEIGVQNPDDKIYAITNRGHTKKHVVESTRSLKNAAFKVLYHIMPGLPGSSPKKDIKMAKTLFDDEKYKPDMLKIYPTLVIPGTALYEMTKKGEYEPYSSEQAAEVISEFYRYIPKYVRVMRIQRDIPATKIHEGVKKSNLREMVEDALRKKKINVQEIRYREIGFSKDEGELQLKRLDYEASKGKEIFLSFENETAIAAFTRLRISDAVGSGIKQDYGMIRELHVYGQQAKLRQGGKVQHKGLGSALLAEAEKIAKEEFDRKGMAVISGVGVREYYYGKGYRLSGNYVEKTL